MTCVHLLWIENMGIKHMENKMSPANPLFQLIRYMYIKGVSKCYLVSYTNYVGLGIGMRITMIFPTYNLKKKKNLL